MDFQTTFKNHRIKRGWTQHQAAKKIGIKVCSIGAYEEGRAFPKPPTLKKIIDTFQPNDLYYFLFGKRTRQRKRAL